MRTILQVPVDPKIRALAEKSALKMGFSSLQETLRIFMVQLSQNKFSLSFNPVEPDEILTPAQEIILLKKVKAAQREKAKGNYIESDNVDELMTYLNK